MERKMATIRKIDAVHTIDGADLIVQYQVGGWMVVDSKDKYKEGDSVIFCEVDSWIPHDIAPFLSRGNEPREYMGIKGEKLRTIRLRKALSQGLLLPMSILDSIDVDPIDDDVTSLLGIVKWEAPEPSATAGMARGNFPGWIRKTDQERVQNLGKSLERWIERGLTFTAQEKMEGSSMTVYFKDGEFGVCSRNMDLKDSEGSTFWRVAKELQLEDKLREYCGPDETVALQGELIGPGVQGNIYKLDKHEFRLFDIYVNGVREREYFVKPLAEALGVTTVPMLGKVEFKTIEDCLALAEGKSELNRATEREGVVFRCDEDADITFKAISNRYLLKQKD